jgi:cytochrome b6-f complex iron-sulfur subunit
MADDNKPTPPGGKASASWLSAENAYRKRKGLPLLKASDYGLEEPAGAAAEPAPEPAAPAAAAAPPAPAPAPAAAGPKVPPPPGGKWSASRLSAENAYRKKKGMPLLTAADVGLEEAAAPPAAATPAPAAPAAAPAATPPAARAPAPPAPVAQRSPAEMAAALRSTTPSKQAEASGASVTGPWDSPIDQSRRRLAWIGIIGFLAAWFIAFFRFFLPRTLFEPSTVFRIGYPSDFGLGVDTKFQQQFRIWVTRTPERLFVIYARCTHLGCTPDWKESENKFKCPCHGSGFDSEGINFEGPAPRPLDRAHVELDPEGQVVVDVSRLYAWVKGQSSEFDNDGAYLRV